MMRHQRKSPVMVFCLRFSQAGLCKIPQAALNTLKLGQHCYCRERKRGGGRAMERERERECTETHTHTHTGSQQAAWAHKHSPLNTQTLLQACRHIWTGLSVNKRL